jgi:hypothetical protein
MPRKPGCHRLGADSAGRRAASTARVGGGHRGPHHDQAWAWRGIARRADPELPNGVVVVEDTGYEGFTRRVLLPAVTEDQALQWRLTLYPSVPAKDGCSEAWSVGVVPGGAFIEQRAGC